MGHIKFFKDLPREDQLEALEQLKRGEQVYGLSDEDDTHIKFATMMVINRLHEIRSDDYNVTFYVEIGYDERGLFVTYPMSQDTTLIDQ